MYTNKKVLITGGTGTIGRHLLKAILTYNPSVVRIYSRDEHKQYEMQQEFSENTNIRYLIGDIRDDQRLLRAMEDIDYVFHLAAMKHVPACEYNPFEAVKTNVLGTQNVIQAAIAAKVKKVLFTSTDKAISPTNTYGATKLTSERLISAAEYQKGPKQTIFSSVRFGNVMSSRGSVIPLFKQQILENRYVTVTNLDMKRYMMTPTQAISLMLKANEMARGGEVFVLKMPVIRLSDLAEVMVEKVTNKYQIKEIVQIKEIGLRPGEKMYEELMSDDEVYTSYETPDMYIIPSHFSNHDQQEYPNAVRTTVKPSVDNDPFISQEVLGDWIMSNRLI
ncbi:SDR family NAD(P)-dependent oxidoreductase [Paenibacillus sp. LMG 31461]|uniref:SDR family NAD(P)-dependent oxidoreductase n=1 Tax=Paenibacillus plantarum TaxID=2654975 RepID=A0ABX1XE43_9BACL|nr:UDP-N-acetylglucosamine 4,6-dehydratase family protein [Paenibacillus plantarum]NOU66748.1 SDR family NAD(P)-dependent oxidoreductase [Paenibacillus plantarum]